MKRRTNSARSLRPRSKRESLPVIDPEWGDEKIHQVVWDRLDSSSDAGGWLFLQTTVFPAMATAEDVASIEEWERVFMEDRGLSIGCMGDEVVLVKDGVPIAGISHDYYEDARDFLTDVSHWKLSVS